MYIITAPAFAQENAREPGTMKIDHLRADPKLDAKLDGNYMGVKLT